MELDHAWAEIRSALRAAVGERTYGLWLEPLRCTGLHEGTLHLTGPPDVCRWAADRLGSVLRACAAAVLGDDVAVSVRADRPDGTSPRPPAPGHEQQQQPPRADSSKLNPKYNFEQFVIGESNRLAHAAALSVAELPAQAYNPLFIYGPPGLGKTHLLHSIGNYVLTSGGGLTVRYTTVETFTNEFLAALQRGDMDRFKGRYRRSDVLLIDDIQFLASKAKTEEEFFHTFNALHDMGSQLVLTCDRLPRDLEALEDRLRERFEAGLVTAIAVPDLATRLTVLRKRVQHDGVVVPDEHVLLLLAERVPHNMRALEGALIRVVAFASLTGRPLGADLAAEVLDDLYPAALSAGAGARPTVEGIQELTAGAFGLTREELLSPSREARLAWPRQVAMYLAREHTDESLPAIGRCFGGRNHTTVMHACRRAAERLASDPDALEIVRRLTERLAPRAQGDPPQGGSLRRG
jgi:chromosomal replication initiator protein